MIPLHFHLAVLRTGKVSYSTSKSRFNPLPALANTGRGGNLFPIYSLFLSMTLLQVRCDVYKTDNSFNINIFLKMENKGNHVLGILESRNLNLFHRITILGVCRIYRYLCMHPIPMNTRP